jgi:hypothetical protein
MAGADYEVPDGAAVFPLIPAELAIDPLLLATLHATVFLAGSSSDIVNEAAGSEALDYMASYLHRLSTAESHRVQQDIQCLFAYGRQQEWSDQLLQSLGALLHEFGIAADGQL